MRHFAFISLLLFVSACQQDDPVPLDAGTDATDMTNDIVPDSSSPDVGTDLGPDTDVSDPFALGTYYDVTCEQATDGFIRVPYTNAQTDGSFQFVVYSPTQEIVTITEVKLPDGSILNLRTGVNEFQVRDDYPIRGFTIPGMESLRKQLQIGQYQFRVSVTGEVCHYVAANPVLGNSFDVNFYFASAKLNAATAPTDADWIEIIARFREIFATSGLQVGTITYHDVDPEIASGYYILNSEDECEELLAQSTLPSEERGNSINLFMVDRVEFFGAAAAVHVINNAAGLHRSRGSGGVVGIHRIGQIGVQLGSGLTADGNDLISQYIAHEVGHLFGLRHTTEVGLRDVDRLVDTPECKDFDVLECPDWNNLMFPGTANASVISPQQAEMIRLHPALK